MDDSLPEGYEEVEHGALDAMVIDAIPVPDAPPPLAPAPLYPIFSRGSRPTSDVIPRQEIQSDDSTPALAPSQIRMNAREYLKAPSFAPDALLTTSERAAPRAGPYGENPKRKRTPSDNGPGGAKVARRSQPETITAAERVLEFPGHPLRDLGGPSPFFLF